MPNLPTVPNFNEPTSLQTGLYTPNASVLSGSTGYYRDLIQRGVMSPTDAYKALYGDYTNAVKVASGGRGYAEPGQNAVNALQQQLFQPLNLVDNQGRQGAISSTQGNVKYDNPFVYKSTTTGAGSSGSGQTVSPYSNSQWIGRPYTPTGTDAGSVAPRIYIPPVPR